MDRRQQLLFDGSLGKRKQHGLVHVGRRALGCGIEVAHRLNLVAEELDAHRTLHLRRIDIEDAAAMRELSRHFDYVHLVVAYGRRCSTVVQYRSSRLVARLGPGS